MKEKEKTCIFILEKSSEKQTELFHVHSILDIRLANLDEVIHISICKEENEASASRPTNAAPGSLTLIMHKKTSNKTIEP